MHNLRVLTPEASKAFDRTADGRIRRASLRALQEPHADACRHKAMHQRVLADAPSLKRPFVVDAHLDLNAPAGRVLPGFRHILSIQRETKHRYEMLRCIAKLHHLVLRLCSIHYRSNIP